MRKRRTKMANDEVRQKRRELLGWKWTQRNAMYSGGCWRLGCWSYFSEHVPGRNNTVKKPLLSQLHFCRKGNS